MHSSRMRIAPSLPYRGSLSESLSREEGLCQGRGSLSRGISVQGVSVQQGLCPGGGFLSGRPPCEQNHRQM